MPMSLEYNICDSASAYVALVAPNNASFYGGDKCCDLDSMPRTGTPTTTGGVTMIARIPAQIVYICDRCRMRESRFEDERLRDDHPLHRWVMITIMPAVERSEGERENESSESERENMTRHAYLCSTCVRDIGQPVDEAPQPAG
jgi:DNA-directed RNA polymerase subunit RPC12/RpoP